MAESDSSLTPEKRLLQLIEGTQADDSRSSLKAKKSFASGVKAVFSPEGFKNLIVDFKDNAVYVFKNRKDFLSLNGVNTLAKFVTIGLGVYLLLSMVYEVKVVNSNYVANLQIPQRDIADIQMSDTRIFDTNLLQEIDKLNVFVPADKRQVEEEKPEEKNSLKLVEIIKDWKLAGISIYPSNPDRTFCMVEDLQKSTTTFLKVGDTLSGLEVAKIAPDSVTLKFNKETIELR
jgi:hypothetical protein